MTQEIRLTGPVLFLTENQELLRNQLCASETFDERQLLSEKLMDNVSTDEIIPGWCCYWYDQRLGEYAYLGLRGNSVTEGMLPRMNPQIIVSGYSKGCGSSREHAVYAEKYAGVSIVFAKSFEKIYQQNCRNVGIITSTDFSLLERLLSGEVLAPEDFLQGLNTLEHAIASSGGLFNFSMKEGASANNIPVAFEAQRPLNIVEKITQSKLASCHVRGVHQSVVQGETYLVNVDVRFSHEYVTPMAARMFDCMFGHEAPINEPASVYCFQDHLTLAHTVLSKRSDSAKLISRVNDLSSTQEDFARAKGLHFIGGSVQGGSRAICHNFIVESVACPGDIVVGTDSHTCSAGALGALAFGVGATDMANAWYTKRVIFKVPPVIAIKLTGALAAHVCAKDLMLTLLGHRIVQQGETLGKILVFGGEGAMGLNIDERVTLCNMAVEAGAVTALFEPDQVTQDYIIQQREKTSEQCEHQVANDVLMSSDPGAKFHDVIVVDLASITPMVSLPGDPKNVVALDRLEHVPTINRVYGGSCTGGKASDMDMYAEVFSAALKEGRKVHPDVVAYVQVGSERVFAYAERKGYLKVFNDAGVIVLPPSCGACINAGPGVSESKTDVTVSAQNRNFNGRSGPGEIYLASPYVVAASAIEGRLASPRDLLSDFVCQ